MGFSASVAAKGLLGVAVGGGRAGEGAETAEAGFASWDSGVDAVSVGGALVVIGRGPVSLIAISMSPHARPKSYGALDLGRKEGDVGVCPSGFLRADCLRDGHRARVSSPPHRCMLPPSLVSAGFHNLHVFDEGLVWIAHAHLDVDGDICSFVVM